MSGQQERLVFPDVEAVAAAIAEEIDDRTCHLTTLDADWLEGVAQAAARAVLALGRTEEEVLRRVASDEDLMEVGRKAVEDELVEWRDARRSVLRNNGYTIREKDGSRPAPFIRFGIEFGHRIALHAIADAMEGGPDHA